MVASKNSWSGATHDNGRFAIACGVGLLLEAAALAVLLPAMTHRESPATTPAPIRISIVAPAPAPPPPVPVPPKPVTPPPVPPPPVPAAPVPPAPVPAAPPLPVTPPLPMPPPHPAAHHLTRHYVKPQPRVPTPPVTPLAVIQPATPPQPAVPPPPTGGQVDLFSAAIKRALQAHANQVYPAAAQMAQQAGSPALTFTYLNGIVTNIALTRSSGFPLLDAAALQDARIASYPPPPPGFTGRSYRITVTVSFQLAAASVDGD